MLKHIIGIILLSVLIVIGMPYAHLMLDTLISAHNWIDEILKSVFSGGDAGNISRQLISLLALPLLVGLIPAIIYWFAKRRWLPYFMQIVWIVWLVQTAAIIVLSKTL